MNMEPTKKPVVEVMGIGKKHVRSLRRSMRYGMMDIAREFFHLPLKGDTLRPDEFWAVEDISFTLKPGESLAVIGPNGAGKSTLLKILNGIMWPDRGRLRIRSRMGCLIEVGAGFHPMLTGRENVYINGAILGLKRRDIRRLMDDIVTFAELEEFIDSPVKFYSSGMYVRLGFSIALHAAPKIFLVDEVLAVGDAAFQRKCLRAMKAYANNGGCLIFVTHDMLAVNSLSTRCLVLNRGRIVFEGSSAEAVEVYNRCEEDVEEGPRVASRSHPDEMRYGNGEVQITGIGVGPAGENSVAIGSSSPLVAGQMAEVQLAITARQDNTGPYNAGISIWEAAGFPLMALNTQTHGHVVPPLRPGEQATVRFRFLCPLTGGIYRMSAGVVDTNTNEFLDRRLNWIDLKVINRGDQFGILSIPSDVRIECAKSME